LIVEYSKISHHFREDCGIFCEGVKCQINNGNVIIKLNGLIGHIKLIKLICLVEHNGLIRLNDLVGCISHNGLVGLVGLVHFIGLGLVGLIGCIRHNGLIGLVSLISLVGLGDFGIISSSASLDSAVSSAYWLIGLVGLLALP